jgi:DNA replication and repair protein RecF
MLSLLEIRNFRNISHITLQLSSKTNIFYGQNGSGKTSILEAIHYLGLGRSFKTRNLNRIINLTSDSFSIIGQLINENGMFIPVGIERKKENPKPVLRIGGKPAHSLLEIVKLLPLQLMNAHSHLLINSGPLSRRQFLDWGVFHVEPSFYHYWQRASRLLKQRNASLKMASTYQDVTSWDEELVIMSSQLDLFRRQYIHLLQIYFEKIIKMLLPAFNFTLNYYPGWSDQKSLREVLYSSFKKDKELGYTQQGPQRADLQLKIGNIAAPEILSQGQQKLATYALRLAQGEALKAKKDQRCLFLIDDLPSELDHKNKSLLADLITQLDCQVFLTGINSADFSFFSSSQEVRMFHVEQGSIHL